MANWQNSMMVTFSASVHGGPSSSMITSPVSVHGGPSSSMMTSPASVHGGPSSRMLTFSASVHGGPSSRMITSPVSAHGGPSSSMITSPVSVHGGPSSSMITSPVSVHGGPSSSMMTFTASVHGGPSSRMLTFIASCHGGPSSSMITSPVSVHGGPSSSMMTFTASVHGGPSSRMLTFIASCHGGPSSRMMTFTASVHGGPSSSMMTSPVSVHGGPSSRMLTFIASVHGGPSSRMLTTPAIVKRVRRPTEHILDTVRVEGSCFLKKRTIWHSCESVEHTGLHKRLTTKSICYHILGTRDVLDVEVRDSPTAAMIVSQAAGNGETPRQRSKPGHYDEGEIKADLTQDQSRCGVCEQVLRDPVTICGHSFCRQCISSYWEQPGLPGDQACPQCGKTCRTQPLQPPLDEHTEKGTQDESLRRVIKIHKACLKRRFENISEGIIKPGAEILLNKIYTELYITKGESEGVNKEHEVWQVESVSRSNLTKDTPINCNNIFKPLRGQEKTEQEKHIRTVMTKGVAGIGKTVSVQKFILDWTDGVANQDIDFMFLLSFRDLNLVRGDLYSLHRLLLDFHPELKELNDSDGYKDCQVLFIFDGLDESRLTLDLEQNRELSDVKQTSSVDVLMTSLIQGTLLPSALIWITARPASASQIPDRFIDQVTEVRGFNDPQKEEYFRKRISDESQANRIISHIQTSRSLHIMCHIPVFCWIAATVLQQILERKTIKDIPKTLTEMFIHFLLIQTTRKDQKYQSGPETDTKKLLESQRNIILKLAELAFKNLEQGNLMFYEEDLRMCGIDVNEASVYSGMCTEIFKTEPVESQQKKVYCFVHLSVQEFLAAVFVFHSYLAEDHESLKCLLSDEQRDVLNPSSVSSFLSSAVDKALESKSGHLDLFLRFLMGISLESNQILLQGLLNSTHNSSNSIKKICEDMKKLNREGLSPERCINLFHCLFEVNDDSMHKEIQTYLSSPKNIKQKLSPTHCSALAHMLLMSEEVLHEFDLKKYNTSDEGRRRLIPALRCCRKARLAECKLSEKSCGIVAAVLQSPNSLIELDLCHNDLGDSGVQLLSKGLSSPHCKLQTLRLAECTLTEKSCGIVATVLQSPNSLIELDLSHNDLGDSGVHLLSKGLSSTHCKLQILRFVDCKLTEKSCGIVAAVLQSPNSLIELDLSHNDLGDSGVQLLSKGLSSPHCKLQTLRLSDCLISEKGCGFLASALTSNPSHLKELDLSYNQPGESGLKLLSARLEDPVCKLEIIKYGQKETQVLHN
ncbi:NACHT, LRR and PYD domains-containing protein 3-like [Sardina pilchardus]|uniref:NACHT, LRR and PYD domains-containing protein 3-like n=1 Tax=Sardina pilchardus TaxID=27697 RepID=UPI002E12EBD3